MSYSVWTFGELYNGHAVMSGMTYAEAWDHYINPTYSVCPPSVTGHYVMSLAGVTQYRYTALTPMIRVVLFSGGKTLSIY
jgi:hypothetical protein